MNRNIFLTNPYETVISNDEVVNNHEGKEMICCAEIVLEKRQGGDIWGKMECCDVVIDDGLFNILKCVTVVV